MPTDAIPFDEIYNSVGIATGTTSASASIPSLSTIYNSVSDPIATQSLTAGYITGDISSANFQTGVAGWKLSYLGNIEANNGNFRGDLTGATGTFSGTLTGGSLNVPDLTTANSFHVDNSGNAWWGTNVATGYATAPAKILNTGAATFSMVKITGLQSGSALDGQYISDGTILAAKVNKGIQGWSQTCVFSSTNLNTVSWGTGSIIFTDGTSYAISAGNTGAMSARTYIYFDANVSTTTYQTTTTAATAVGNGKVLIASSINDTVSALFEVFGGVGGLFINGNVIAANSIVANTLNVSQLSAITADMGAITAGTIVLNSSGYIRGGQTAYNTGTGFFLGYDTSAYKLSMGNASTKLFTYDGTDFTLTGGTITGGVFQTSATGARFVFSAGDSTITQYWKNGSADLAQITLADSSAQFQALQFGLWDTVNNDSKYVSLSRRAIGSVGFHPNSVNGWLGEIDNPWTYEYLSTTLFLQRDSSFSGITWQNSTGAIFNIQMDDMTVRDYAKLSFKTTVGGNGFYVERSGVSNIDIYPNDAPGTVSGRLGTDTYFWRWMYSYYVRYKDLASFEDHDDISLIKNIQEKTVNSSKMNMLNPSEETPTDAADITTPVWDYDSMPDEVKVNGFYDAGAVNGLLIGALKQLITRVETLEGQLNN